MSETRPISTKTNASTLASTGRSLKKREIMPVPRDASFRCRAGDARLGGVRGIGGGRRQLGLLRLNHGAGKRPLNAFSDHPIARIESGFDDPQLTLPLSGFDD